MTNQKKITRKTDTHRLTLSAVMLALAAAVAFVCGLIPPLQLPAGGGFTLASMLPIILISYIYGVKWGFFTSLTYAVIQIAMSLMQGKSGTVMALFLPDSGLTVFNGIIIILIDYIVAYGILGIGGIFRSMKNKTVALTLGAVLATLGRYIAHIISGYIFYGAWATWFFEEKMEPAVGAWFLSAFDGKLLSFVYSVVYNGCYMIPEIVITAVCAVVISRLPQVKVRMDS